MTILKEAFGIVLPIISDTLPGREMKTSYIEKKIFHSPKQTRGFHLLSPSHIKRMKNCLFDKTRYYTVK